MVSYYLPQVFCICDNTHDIIIIPEYPVIPAAGKSQNIRFCPSGMEYLDIDRTGKLVAASIQDQVFKLCLQMANHSPFLHICLVLFILDPVVQPFRIFCLDNGKSHISIAVIHLHFYLRRLQKLLSGQDIIEQNQGLGGL